MVSFQETIVEAEASVAAKKQVRRFREAMGQRLVCSETVWSVVAGLRRSCFKPSSKVRLILVNSAGKTYRTRATASSC